VPLRFRGVAALVCLGFVVSGCSEPDTDIRVRNPTGGVQTPLPVRVMRVIDGDTLQVQMPNDNERRVRVIGIDTRSQSSAGSEGGRVFRA
jgi:micrococcal nuclease